MSFRRPTWWRPPQQSRHPVSRWRRRISLGVLIVVLLVVGAYRHLTDEKRLRKYAEHWLEQFSGGDVEIRNARFSLFRGLDLIGVRIATPSSAGFARIDEGADQHTIFRSDSLYLRLRPTSIISGNLVVPQIVAVNPEINLVHRSSDGLGNWEVMFQTRRGDSRGGPTRLPEIRLRNAKLRQFRLDEGRIAGGAPQALWVEALPAADVPDVYRLRISKFLEDTGDREAKAYGEASEIEIDMRTLAVSGSLPSMSIDELLFTTPSEVKRWLDTLGLRGYVRTDNFHYDAKAGPRATLRVRDAALSIPIDEEERDHPEMPRYVRFERAAGTFVFDGEGAEVELTARFRDSDIALRGHMMLPMNQPLTFAGVGLDITVTATAVPLPRCDHDTDPAERRFVRRWEHLSDFVRWYDGRGPADLHVTLHKEPGEAKGVRFVEGTLALRGDVSATYHKFKYHFHEGRGEVRFRKDGKVELRDLRGVHGDARISMSGLQGGFASEELELKVVGENVSMDENLLSCLSDGDRQLCRFFNAAARMNIEVRLRREDRRDETVENPPHREIDVTFLDGSVNLQTFPYPLTGLSGRMRIVGREFEIQGLRARHGEMTVEINGRAERVEGGGFNVDLSLQATGVPLDGRLAQALPEHARGLYERHVRSGVADVKGRIFTPAGSDRIQYELDVSLSGGEFAFAPDGTALKEAEGQLRVRPEALFVTSLRGGLGDSTIDVEGRIGMAPGDPSLVLHMRSDSLLLDETLRRALPQAVQATWDSFEPAGRVRADLRYERQAATSQPVDDQAGPATDYALVIEPLGCEATYEGFPLRVKGVTGRIVVAPGHVAIERIQARHEQTQFDMAGAVVFAGAERQVNLAVKARDLEFSEALRKAVPWRLRRLWNDTRPQGRLDVDLDRFEATVKAGERPVWRFDGRASLAGAGVTIGVALTETVGEMALRGEFGPQISLEGDLHLRHVHVDGRPVENLQAHVVRASGSAVVKVQDIVARLCDGMVEGWAEVDYGPGRPTFALSLAGRDISLQRFLNAKRKPDQEPVRLKGRVEAALSIWGRLGEPATRLGQGYVLIHEAQMLKVPLMLAILQVIHFAVDDDNAFHDASFTYGIEGDTLILDQIDLRGKALSMVGAGRVRTPTTDMDLTLLIGSPLKLPRFEVLTELAEGLARELVEVHVEGTLEKPTYRAELVRSVRKTLEAILSMRRSGERLEWEQRGLP